MKTRSFLWVLSFTWFLVAVGGAYAQAPKAASGRDVDNFISMRDRVKIAQRFWDWKRENVLPMVMREQGIDMWIIRNDEEPLYRMTSYREHPVYTSLLPATHEGMTLPSQYENSRSDNPEFLMYYDTGDEIEYIEPDSFGHVTRLVQERDPKKIAISMKHLYVRRMDIDNTSQYGVVQTEEMVDALGDKYAARAVDSWILGIRWLSTLGPEQISIYRYVQGLHNDIIAEAFSNRVIIPDVTTTEDLNWWLRHRYLDLHLEIDNHPTVMLKRRPSKIAEYDDPPGSFTNGVASNGVNVVIRRGDVVSLDSDIMLLGVETDSHQHAYVLQEGEDDVPEDLKEALRIVNDIQDKYRAEFKHGRTAQEIQDASARIPRHKLIVGSSNAFHPPPMFIRRFTENGLLFSRGTYVTGIGRGYKQHPLLSPDLPVHYNTIYAFEPHTSIAVPGWGERGLEIGVGQLAVFTEDGLEYLDRPMLEWHVIK